MAKNTTIEPEKGLIDWQKATTDEKDRILRQIAHWYSEGEGQGFIAKNLEWWFKKHFSSSPCYRGNKQPKGGQEQKLTIDRHWVKRRITELQKDKYLTLREPERERFIKPVEDTLGKETGLKGIALEVAAHRNDMLRKAVLRLETLLAEKFEATSDDTENPNLILTTSGGQTLLNFAHAVAQIPMPTLQSIAKAKDPDGLRKRLLVCSLTSGGMRDDISSLSDTVAAVMANNLGCGARGLLGPAWFEKAKDMQDFDKLKDVKDHKSLVMKAQIILTSVGWLENKSNLMARLLRKSKTLKGEGKKQVKLDSNHPADLLYNLYDGWSGGDVDLPEHAQGHFFSVMGLKDLKERIQDEENKPAVIVLASGWDKGYHSVLGLIHGKLATEIFLDAESSAGLGKAVEDCYHGTSE